MVFLTAGKHDFEIEQGATFKSTVVWTDDLKEVSSITRASTTATVTVVNHGLSVGNYVLILGADDSDYNGVFQVASSADDDTFTYTLTGAPATPATSTTSGQIKMGKCKSLAGYSANMDIREKIEDSSALETLSTTGGEIVITTAQGKLVMTLTTAQTGALDFNRGVYDLELVSGVGVVTRLIQGEVDFKKEVTRS